MNIYKGMDVIKLSDVLAYDILMELIEIKEIMKSSPKIIDLPVPKTIGEVISGMTNDIKNDFKKIGVKSNNKQK